MRQLLSSPRKTQFARGLRISVLALMAVSLFAQEREKAADWPVHATLKTAALGAEYMVRSVIHPQGNVVVRDYLIVEVAVYPNKRETVMLSHQHFTLRINGKKTPIHPQTPGMVAASVKYEDWERRPGLTAQAGPIILGRPQPTERFPGDPRPRQQRLPNPPQAPAPEDRSGVEKEPALAPDEVIVRAAIEEGETQRPKRGYLYFAQKGKAETFKKIELVYSGPAGDATLVLK